MPMRSRACLPTSDDPWWTALEALWQVHELAYDGPALVAATRKIVAHDRYHRRALQMAMRARADRGTTDRRRSRTTSTSRTACSRPYTRLVEVPDKWQR